MVILCDWLSLIFQLRKLFAIPWQSTNSCIHHFSARWNVCKSEFYANFCCVIASNRMQTKLEAVTWSIISHHGSTVRSTISYSDVASVMVPSKSIRNHNLHGKLAMKFPLESVLQGLGQETRICSIEFAHICSGHLFNESTAAAGPPCWNLSRAALKLNS